MKTSGVSCETKFGLLVFLGHPIGYYPKLLPSLTAEWLERSIPVPGVMGLNPAVSGGFFQSNLWRRLAQCLNFDSVTQ